MVIVDEFDFGYGRRMTSAEVVGGFTVRVTFSDGAVADCDLRHRYVHPDGKLIGSPAEFALVRLDEKSDSLLWPDEFFHEHGESLYETFAAKPSQTSS